MAFAAVTLKETTDGTPTCDAHHTYNRGDSTSSASNAGGQNTSEYNEGDARHTSEYNDGVTTRTCFTIVLPRMQASQES